MSIRIDILAAKAGFDEHVGAHKCRARLLAEAVGEVPCEARTRLWLAYMDTARRWGTEPGDGQRLAELYAWQTASLKQQGTTWDGMRRAA